MQMLPSFPVTVWNPSASDLWRLWNHSKAARRPSVIDSSDLEDMEFLLSALRVESLALCAEISKNE